MKENKKKGVKLRKKIIVLSSLFIFLVLSFFIINKFEEYKISGNAGGNTKGGFWGQVKVGEVPAPTCFDKIQNQGEIHVDCGGPCNACPPDCSDGIKNQDETGVDCGGTICSACPTCFDKIQNQGEIHVDCGGPCNACPPDCSDGIKNQDETGVDCGGTICSACPQRPVITSAQKTLISQTILSSAFVKDLPTSGVIALRFYDFFIGERIWHDDILIGKSGILSGGTPDLVLIMHARYISQLNGANLCDVIKSAQTNGEMWTESSQSNAKLLLKYSGMIKYRDCFGF